MNVSNRPRGRRPGHVDTRSEIVEAALKLFSEIGYVEVSLRAVAREADVDPALIHHYFADKADLFAAAVLGLEVIEPATVVEQILDGPVEKVGERAVAAFYDTWALPGARKRFAAMLRAAVSEPGAQTPMSQYLAREVYYKVAEALGRPNSHRRGQLAVALIIGYAVSSEVLGFPALADPTREEWITALGQPMQRYLADPW